MGLVQKVSLACVILGAPILNSGCAQSPEVEIHAPVIESLYDIVHTTMKYYENGKLEQAEKYLEERAYRHKSLNYMYTVTLANNLGLKDLIFGEKLEKAAAEFEDFVTAFEIDSRVLYKVRELLPRQFFKAEVYGEFKQELRNNISIDPKKQELAKKLLVAYGMVCLVEGDFGNEEKGAVWAFTQLRELYSDNPKRKNKFAEQIRTCAGNDDNPEHEQFMKVYHAINPPLNFGSKDKQKQSFGNIDYFRFDRSLKSSNFHRNARVKSSRIKINDFVSKQRPVQKGRNLKQVSKRRH